MSLSAPSLRRVVVGVALLLVLLLVWSTTRSGSEAAAPARADTGHAGKVAFASLPGSVDVTLPLRTFGAGGANTSTVGGGGGGVGKFVADDVTLALDASEADPLLLRAVATGVHLQTVTVTLFRPGTTKRQQVWEFGDVTVSGLGSAQSGSSKAPRLSVGLRYDRVTLTTYAASGGVARSYCYSVVSATGC